MTVTTIVGITVGSIVALSLLVGVVVIFIACRRRKPPNMEPFVGRKYGVMVDDLEGAIIPPANAEANVIPLQVSQTLSLCSKDLF
jgi:hypothetical protein